MKKASKTTKLAVAKRPQKMAQPTEEAAEHSMAELAQENEKITIGFWLYILSDCILFGTLFTMFAVLRHNTFGGATSPELVSPGYALVESLVLLTSSYACGRMMIAARAKSPAETIRWLVTVFILGAVFIGMELSEFAKLVQDGHSWRASAFLSSFFTLVGTHGLHITVGLIWASVLGVYIAKNGLKQGALKKLQMFSLYWHFLDIVWICIFTVVYLRGAY